MPTSRETYCEFHENPAYDNAIAELYLYCIACSRSFIPEGPDPVKQGDEDCLCGECREAVELMKEGIIT